jgi:hypothetical protein
VPQLNNLHASRQAIQPRVIEAAVPSSLEPSLKGRLTCVLEAELAFPSLVEVIDERDVEVCHVGTETQVNVGEGVVVRAVDRDGASCHGPLGAVGHVGCLVDVGAWEELVGERVCGQR